MSALNLLRGEFGNLERTLKSSDWYCKRVYNHELALVADITPGVGWNLLTMTLYTIKVLISFTLSTFD